jgi:hypothetical protein
VSKIEPSHFNGATACVALTHLMDSRAGMHPTADYGATWKRVNGDREQHPLSCRRGGGGGRQGRDALAGAGHGFFYSTDDGGHGPACDRIAACAGQRSVKTVS